MTNVNCRLPVTFNQADIYNINFEFLPLYITWKCLSAADEWEVDYRKSEVITLVLVLYCIFYRFRFQGSIIRMCELKYVRLMSLITKYIPKFTSNFKKKALSEVPFVNAFTTL
jgi:hypothetical protein